MTPHKKAFIVNGLRRLSYKWVGRWTAEKRSKLSERNTYYCEQCGIIVGKKETRMDHIQPIIDPVEGWQGFSDAYMDRFFIEPEGWQRLCLDCDSIKTKAENAIRYETKSNNKRKNK